MCDAGRSAIRAMTGPVATPTDSSDAVRNLAILNRMYTASFLNGTGVVRIGAHKILRAN
jgi:hypothetical protein